MFIDSLRQPSALALLFPFSRLIRRRRQLPTRRLYFLCHFQDLICEVSDKVSLALALTTTAPATPNNYEKEFFIPEFLSVMIKKEVRSYMSGIEQNGMCVQAEAVIRNAVVNRVD